MRIYPAIDLYLGKVVRLTRGDYERVSVYFDRPAEPAKLWEAAGAEWLHVVDLGGAKEGRPQNLEALRLIREAVRCRIQFGGGLRTAEDVDAVLGMGVDRVIVGTRAMDSDFLRRLLDRHAGRVAVSLDVREGTVRTDGWLKAGSSLNEALAALDKAGAQFVIYTNVHLDGMLGGADWDGLGKVLDATRARVILAGGVAGIGDVERALRVDRANFEGVIAGKALYEGRLDLAEAVKTIGGKSRE